MTNLTAAILEKCTFVEKPGSSRDLTWMSYEDGKESENARLMPIIEALLKSREELTDALERIKAGESILDDGLIAMKALASEEKLIEGILK